MLGNESSSAGTSTLWVGDLSHFVTEQALASIFGHFHIPIISVKIGKGRSGDNLQYAFVQVPSELVAIALQTMNEQKFMGRKMRVFIAGSANHTDQSYREDWVQVHVSFLTVSQIHYNINEEFLDQLFSRFGAVADVSIKQFNIQINPPKQNGYGFVYFYEVDAALRAIDFFKDCEIDNIRYDCQLSHRSRTQFGVAFEGNSHSKHPTAPLAIAIGAPPPLPHLMSVPGGSPIYFPPSPISTQVSGMASPSQQIAPAAPWVSSPPPVNNIPAYYVQPPLSAQAMMPPAPLPALSHPPLPPPPPPPPQHQHQQAPRDVREYEYPDILMRQQFPGHDGRQHRDAPSQFQHSHYHPAIEYPQQPPPHYSPQDSITTLPEYGFYASHPQPPYQLQFQQFPQPHYNAAAPYYSPPANPFPHHGEIASGGSRKWNQAAESRTANFRNPRQRIVERNIAIGRNQEPMPRYSHSHAVQAESSRFPPYPRAPPSQVSQSEESSTHQNDSHHQNEPVESEQLPL